MFSGLPGTGQHCSFIVDTKIIVEMETKKWMKTIVPISRRGVHRIGSMAHVQIFLCGSVKTKPVQLTSVRKFCYQTVLSLLLN